MTQVIPHSEDEHVYFISGANNWVSWTKPKDISFVHMIVIGAGGGGSGGSTAAGVGRGGGGAGAVATAVWPSFMLPDTIYIFTGIGGYGGHTQGASVRAPGDGGNTYVMTMPFNGIFNGDSANITTTAYYTLIRTNGGEASPNSTVAGPETFSNSDDTLVRIYGPLRASSIHNVMVGRAGAQTTNSIYLTHTTLPTIGNTTSVGLTTGGGGGGPASNVGGGNINAYGANTGAQFDGSQLANRGLFNRKPLFFLGGNGGGGSTGGSGIGLSRRGGDGEFGCGGGGATPISGRGGNGGNGLVIITCW